MWRRKTGFSHTPYRSVYIDTVHDFVIVKSDRNELPVLGLYSLDGVHLQNINLPFEEVGCVCATKTDLLVLRDAWDESYTVKFPFDQVETSTETVEEYDCGLEAWERSRFAYGFGEDCDAVCNETLYVITCWAQITVFNHVTGAELTALNTFTPTSTFVRCLCVVDNVVVFLRNNERLLHVYATDDGTHVTVPVDVEDPSNIVACEMGFYIMDKVNGLVKVAGDGSTIGLQTLDPVQTRASRFAGLSDGSLVFATFEGDIAVYEQVHASS